MKKAVLLQLPVPGFTWPVLDANLPLAAGYLAAWASLRAPGWEVEIVPWSEADVLGDEALFGALVARRPDLVGFSLYLWNSERSLFLAQRLAEVGVRVALGGPETASGNLWLEEASGFAAVIPGEGEEPFARLLRSLSGKGPAGPPCADAHVDPSQLPSPYLTGRLAPWPDGTVWLETQRGCPFRCAYCHYGKRYGGPQPFPERWLPDHLTWARRSGVREVYLMDPSFNVRRDWDRVLRVLEEGNPDGGLRYHTELVAEALRPGDAERLARAGLRSCELGLQTVRADALARVGRAWDRERWVRGARELVDAGVDVTVGLIVGLPADDLDGFAQTLAFLRDEVPGAEAQVFPLAVLPGTELAARAREFGLEARDLPPYTVSRTGGYGPGDVTRAFDLYEEVTGLELDPFGAPPLGGSWGGTADGAPYLSGVKLHAATAGSGWVDAVVPLAARNLCVWVVGWNDRVPSDVGRLSRLLPHVTLTVVFDDGAGWPPERLSAVLDAAGTGDRYLDRYFSFLYGDGARVVPRLAVLLPAEARPGTRWREEIRRLADVVWRVEVKSGWVSKALEAAEDGDAVCVAGEPDDEELENLAGEREDGAGELLFSSDAAAGRWRRLGGPARPPEGFSAEEKRAAVR